MNKKHIAFCHKLVELNFNQSKAYREIYPNAKPDSAKALSSELLTKVNVQEYLSLLMNQSVQDSKVTVKEVIHNIKNDSQMARVSGQLTVSMKGNELLGKHLGMLTDKIEHSGSMAIDGMTKEQLKELHNKTKDK